MNVFNVMFDCATIALRHFPALSNQILNFNLWPNTFPDPNHKPFVATLTLTLYLWWDKVWRNRHKSKSWVTWMYSIPWQLHCVSYLCQKEILPNFDCIDLDQACIYNFLNITLLFRTCTTKENNSPGQFHFTGKCRALKINEGGIHIKALKSLPVL